MQRSKFLGIVTTEVSGEEYLSVVDGQQRLTTIMLILIQLYNLCADEGETETQSEIQELISSQIGGQNFFKLINGSLGEYLYFYTDENGRNKIRIDIDTTHDIYKQAKKFDEACMIIQTAFVDRDQSVTLDSYKQRLVDCEMLLFAQKNTANIQQGSSEEIYIDINEKAQRLDPEDIFKGHCFAICKTIEQQNQVKMLWRSIKQNFFSMANIFKKDDMGVFLHFFLLTQEAEKSNPKDIKKDLTIAGENIIIYHYNTPTKAINLLKSIEKFQLNLIDFANKIGIIGHDFPKIMTTDAQTLGNSTEQMKELNAILRDVIACNQDLFKFPLFYLVNQNYRKEPSDKLTYKQLAGFTYLYYVYMFLFSRIGGSTKRKDLPSKLINKMSMGQDYLVQFVKEIIAYSGDTTLDRKFISDDITRKQLYIILDRFKYTATNIPASHDGELSFKLRLFPETYNLEHLVVNQSRSIKWCSNDETEYEFADDDFSACDAWARQYNKWSNFIWIDGTFNRDILKNKDIINKLILLRGTAVALNAPEQGTYAKKHYHIEVICQHIMATEGFDELLRAYSNNESRQTVLTCYENFIKKYFDDENIDILRTKLETQFKEMLCNLENLIL